MDFEFKVQHDYDLHIAVEVDQATLEKKFAEGKARGIETRGVSDHGFIHSIYFRDPSGYVIELTMKMPNHDRVMDPASNGARAKLDRWQAAKQSFAKARKAL
jgi:catechol-2,3-dioxygenase